MKKNCIYLVLILVLNGFQAWSQQNQEPFKNEILHFARLDSTRLPKPGANLFAGSSSFRLWKGIQDSFPEVRVINRGFGGSTLSDLILYKEETILKYEPAHVIIYCGENDIASSETVTAVMVRDRFGDLFRIMRNRLPGVKISFVSMKPSPSRWHMRDRLVLGNQLIKDFLLEQENTSYIDIWEAMLDENGMPDKTLFTGDNLHMNEKGYAIWKRFIEPELLPEQ